LVTQLLVPPFDEIVSVDVPVPPDASVKLVGDITHVGAVTFAVGVTAHVSATDPTNPPADVPVITDVLVVTVFTVVVAERVVGFAARVKLPGLFTTSDSAAEVDVSYVVSPLYTAVVANVPGVANVCEALTATSLLNVTGDPIAVPAE
jgi:hypothetical protein